MSRSSSRNLIGVALGVGVAGLLGWLAVRLVQTQLQRRTAGQSQGDAASSTATTTGTNDTRDLVPEAVFTDAEPTAMEAAFRVAAIEVDNGEDEVNTNMDATLDTAGGQWIGNTRTLVFHRADSAMLPAEENRQYFRSEDEAIAAGYRRAANE